MPEQDNWKEEFENKFVNVFEEYSTWKKDGKNADNVLHFIEKTLSSQARALKERMKSMMEKKKDELGELLSAKNIKQTALSYHARSAIKQKMQIIHDLLSAIESIEI